MSETTRLWVAEDNLTLLKHVTNETREDQRHPECTTIMLVGEWFKDCPCGEVTWARRSFSEVVRRLVRGDHIQ